MAGKDYTEMERLRSYSSIFSRSVFSDIIEYDDYTRLNILLERYNNSQKHFQTYLDYIKYAYHTIARKYRCEYVYKNEIISKLLIRKYGTKNTIALNEFRVRNSIVDFALFNGESKAFEIKTEYDTQKRLEHQIEEYSKLFEKCYVVIPDKSFYDYENNIPKNVGIIILTTNYGRIQLKEMRKALPNEYIDIDVLMRSIRTIEYKNIVKNYFGKIPEVSCFEMFEECKSLISKIPQSELHKLFLTEIKRRKNNTLILKSLPIEIRQICLSMNLNKKQSDILLDKLNNAIII